MARVNSSHQKIVPCYTLHIHGPATSEACERMDVKLDSFKNDNRQLSTKYKELEDAFVDRNFKHEVFIKQTLVSSSAILGIFPQFKVRLNKEFRGLTSSTYKDDEFQLISAPTEDSQADVFDEMDILEEFDHNETNTTDYNFDRAIYNDVTVLVKHLSLVVDDIEYKLKAPVRSFCRVRAGVAQEEDHLAITLTSGFLLLLRVYHIPRQVSDSDYSYNHHCSCHQKHHHYCDICDKRNMHLVFKPFIIQWWNLVSKGKSHIDLQTSGFDLKSTILGSATVSLSASDSFRLYATAKQSLSGIVFESHLNVALGGSLIDSCFLEPRYAAQTDMFLTLVFTEQRRLFVNLYSWSNFYGPKRGIDKTTLPLRNTFEIPVFIAPLNNNGSFLFVSPTNLLILTVHDIISAEHIFKSKEAPWTSFPTSFYVPESRVFMSKNTNLDVKLGSNSNPTNTNMNMSQSLDEVIIATKDGILYSVVVADNDFVSIQPIFKVTNAISSFTFEASNNAKLYILSFASIGGGGKILRLCEKHEKKENKEKKEKNFANDDNDYDDDKDNENDDGDGDDGDDGDGDKKRADSKSYKFDIHSTIENYDAWAPVVDCVMVPLQQAKNSTLPECDELWALIGLNRKRSLSQIHDGYTGRKLRSTYTDWRKATKTWLVILNNTYYIFCLLPFQTILLELDESDKIDPVMEIQDPLIGITSDTVFVSTMGFGDDEMVIQITSNSIILTNLSDTFLQQGVDYTILFAEVIGRILVLVGESNEGRATLYAYIIADPNEKLELEINTNTNTDTDTNVDDIFILWTTIHLDSNPSMLKSYRNKDSMGFVLGTYAGTLEFYNIDKNSISLGNIVHLKLFSDRSHQCDNISREFFIPNDFVQNNNNLALVGMQNGFVFCFENSQKKPVYQNFWKIGEQSVLFLKVDLNITFIACGSLFLYDPQAGKYPQKVNFNELQPRTIGSMLYMRNTSVTNKRCRLALFRNNGLVLTEVSMYKRFSTKSIRVSENSTKVQFLPALSLFAIFCTSNTSLKKVNFVDKKTLRIVKHVEEIHFSKRRSRSSHVDLVFKPDEKLLSFCVWEIERNNKITHKYLVGTACVDNESMKPIGYVRVLDIKRNRLNKEQSSQLILSELTLFEHSCPVQYIRQWRDQILFAGDSSIWCTSYDETLKKFTTPTLHSVFLSEITNFHVQNDIGLVCTSTDSIFQISLELMETTAVRNDTILKPYVDQLNYKTALVGSNKLTGEISIMQNGHIASSSSSSLPLLPLSFSSLLAMGMSHKQRTFNSNMNLKIPGIAKLFAAKLNNPWIAKEIGNQIMKSDEDITILCITVSGSVIALRSVKEDCKELQLITQSLKNKGNSFEILIGEYLQKLDRPLKGKLAGTGLYSLNKPYFEFVRNYKLEDEAIEQKKERKNIVIDYDLDEVSTVAFSKISL